MASLQQDGPSGRSRIRFYVGEREYKRSLKTKDPRVAESILGRVEVPEGADLGCFVLADGKVAGQAPEAKIRTLGDLLDIYTTTYPAVAKEESTTRTEQTHFSHLRRHLGAKTPVRSLGASHLQGYIGERLKDKWRGRTIGSSTIKNEIDTGCERQRESAARGGGSGRHPIPRLLARRLAADGLQGHPLG